jgi:dTDP-4-dehydrorhamnose 3,5-epimerase-like enzyme
MLPSSCVIFPHPPHNIVKRAVLVEFVLCINNLFKIKIIFFYNYNNNLLKISWKLEINTNLKFVKPCIDIRSLFRMSGNLTLLK